MNFKYVEEKLIVNFDYSCIHNFQKSKKERDEKNSINFISCSKLERK